MTLRIAICASVLALSVTLAGATTGDPGWKGSGWYVVVHSIGGEYIDSGPYASKEACDATRPADEEYEFLRCEYWSEQPVWAE